MDEFIKKLPEIEDIRIDRLDSDSINIPVLHNKYLKIFYFIKSELNVLILKRKLIYRRKWLYYSGKAEPKVYDENPLDVKIMKSDVKMFIESDKDIIKLDKDIKILELRLKYIEEQLNMLNRRSFIIKNTIDYLKFKNGEF